MLLCVMGYENTNRLRAVELCIKRFYVLHNVPDIDYLLPTEMIYIGSDANFFPKYRC